MRVDDDLLVKSGVIRRGIRVRCFWNFFAGNLQNRLLPKLYRLFVSIATIVISEMVEDVGGSNYKKIAQFLN